MRNYSFKFRRVSKPHEKNMIHQFSRSCSEKNTPTKTSPLSNTKNTAWKASLVTATLTNAIISFSNHVLPTEWGEIFHQCFINSNLRENNGIMVKSNFFENVVIISPLKLKRNCAQF